VGDYKTFVQGSVIHQSSTTYSLEASRYLAGDTPAFTTFDFSAGTAMGNWHVEAYVENAFDKRGELGRIAQCATDYCFSHYHSYPIKPMNFGVKFGPEVLTLT